MNIKINDSLFHLPPFISTSWENIESLSLDGSNLIIILKSGSKVVIPHLDQNILQHIFAIHAQILEKKANPMQIRLGFPLQMGEGGIETLGNSVAHNPDQTNAPDLPPEILEKIIGVAKVLGLPENMPPAETNCNCVYCQIARALKGEAKPEILDLEEEVSAKDLSFRSWEIKETADHLFLVTNPLDQNDQYRVHLKDPFGCTCGEKNCEHLRAVLNS
jgi:hypothetical protein